MILNFTKVDKVRLSLQEYTFNTRLTVKGQNKRKQNGTDKQINKQKKKNKDKVVLQQWATVFKCFHITLIPLRIDLQ